MTFRTGVLVRSVLAIGTTLGLVAGALPAAAAPASTDIAAGALSRTGSDAASVKPPSLVAPSLKHAIYVVAMHGNGAVPPFALPAVREAAQQAGDYWVEQTGGAIAQFDVVGQHMVLSKEPCRAINNVNSAPTAEWDAAAGQFPGVDFSSGQNHLVVVAPPACQREGSSVATLGSGIASGGKSLVGGIDVQTITQSLGSNLSLGSTVHGFERDGVLQERWHLGMFGPQSYSFDDAGPGALDVGFQDALGVLPIQQVEYVGTTGTVTLAPVTQPNGVRGATFIDPVSGDRVWVEYRDGKGRDAGSG